MKERLLGVVFLAAGVLLLYSCIYEPLQKAQGMAEKVSVSQKGAIFCPLALGVGLLYLLLGPSVKNLLGTREEPKFGGVIIALLLAVIGFVLYFGVKSKIESYGYQFR